MSDILIVDDNAPFRQALKDILVSRFSQVSISEAGDGNEAFRKIDNHRPVLIFMDIQLPGENGLELTKKIKGLYPEIVIIVITNYPSSDYREAAFEYRADHFLSKESSSPKEIAALVSPVISH